MLARWRLKQETLEKMSYPTENLSEKRRNALLCLLYFNNGQLKSHETYDPLAQYFSLTTDERTQIMSDGTSRNYWENLVQNSRKDLVKSRLIDNSVRGLWKLTSDGLKEAEKIASQYYELSPEPLLNTDDIKTYNDYLEYCEETISQAQSSNIVLKKYPKQPKQIHVYQTVYIRNPHIVVATLKRADGICEMCKSPAPFIRDSDGTPYLEVHHKIPLASGGEDTIENTIALCPNCHRRAHYAKKDVSFQ